MSAHIIKGDKLTIPLYHGTTALFVNSINEFGLGGKDPLKSYNALNLLQSLWCKAESQLANDSFWLSIRERFQTIVEQNQFKGVLNQQHGETYLTCNPEIAVKYAVECPNGGEFLTNLREFIQLLILKNVSGVKEEINSHPLRQVLDQYYDPYVLKVESLDINALATETGLAMDKQIAKISHNMSNSIISPLSFKLKSEINPQDIEIKKIGKWQTVEQQLALKVLNTKYRRYVEIQR